VSFSGPTFVGGGDGFRSPFTAVAADVDGDGDMDVLTSSYTDGIIAWHENTGAGVFKQHVVSRQSKGAFWPAAVDVDADGHMDIVAASQLDDKLECFFNIGSGHFINGLRISVPNIRRVLAADLDGDGDQDLVVVASKVHRMSWFEYDGRHRAGREHPIGSSAKKYQSVHVVDIDGDGDLDILFTLLAGGYVMWYENGGNGIFNEAQQLLGIAGGRGLVHSMHVSDLDSDGDADILVLAVAGLHRFYNLGNGTFEERGQLQPNADEVSFAAHAADINGDGIMDVLVGSSTSISWFRGIAEDSFAAPAVLCEPDNPPWMFSPVDIDGDGDVDLLVTVPKDNLVGWYASEAVHDLSM